MDSGKLFYDNYNLLLQLLDKYSRHQVQNIDIACLFLVTVEIGTSIGK